MPDLAPRAAALLDARTVDPIGSQRGAERLANLPHTSARELLARYGPVTETLAQIKREPLVALHQLVALEAADAAREAIAERNGKSAQSFMIAAGIASEKALLFAGQPTAIVAATHAHRLALPDEAARLAVVAARLARVAARALPGGGDDTGSGDPLSGARDVTPPGIIGTDDPTRGR